MIYLILLSQLVGPRDFRPTMCGKNIIGFPSRNFSEIKVGIKAISSVR